MAKRAKLNRPFYWRWYHTPQWKIIRRDLLNRKPYCVFCYEKGIQTQATVADHIEPHRGDYKLFFNLDNLQPLCATCHSGEKKRRERRYYQDRQLNKKWVTNEDGWIERRRHTV